jgi:hypothetical protein
MALSAALPYRSVLGDLSLTPEEMREITGLSKNTVDIYRSALIRVGLVERR